MSEDNSVDLLGVKPLAKAVEKATERSVDGISSFFGAICMPAAEELGLLLKDKIAAYRSRNLEAIAQKTQAKLEGQKLNLSGDANPLLVRQVIEDASWTSDSTMQSMWAGLLAVAATTTAAADDSLIYTDTLRKLTPFQAHLLNKIYGDPRCCSVKPPVSLHDGLSFHPENPLMYSAVDVLKIFPGDLATIVPIHKATHESVLENEQDWGIAVSRFRPQIEALVPLGLIHQVSFLQGGGHGIKVEPSLKGLDLYMRCLGCNIYPLEAFIVAQQYWCKQKGIDPFTFGRPSVDQRSS
jgi:hypothetical protein